ncbi:MAG: hypothetical protein JXB35_08370 [Anaerolineae bacterium]|nr:hypothetical protein [Anaerolineae bacterium]
MNSQPDYTSFLIRLWHEPAASPAPPMTGQIGSTMTGHEWLIQIEHIPGGEKLHFTSLEALFAYIQTWIGQQLKA